MDKVIENINNASASLSAIQGVADYNSARSAEQAQMQRDWQVQQNAKAMDFNRQEAQKNRDWQEYMSNTAHQREIADLKAAGLNPVLSAMNGNGASVGSGATASGVTSSGAKGEVDTSANAAMVNLLGTIMDNQNKLQTQTMSAINNLAVAEKYTETSKIVQSMVNENQKYLAANYPNNMWSAIPALIGAFTGDSPTSSAKELKEFATYVTGGSDKPVETPKILKPIENVFEKLDKGVKANDGWPLITKWFPFLKKEGNIFDPNSKWNNW